MIITPTTKNLFKSSLAYRILIQLSSNSINSIIQFITMPTLLVETT